MGRREPLDHRWDKFTTQPVNDIIPYFVFKETTTVKCSNTASGILKSEDRFYAGFQLAEKWFHSKRGEDFVFEWNGKFLIIPQGALHFVDINGERWEC